MARAVGLVVLCLALMGCDGDRATSADVGGQTYVVADASDVDLDGVDLVAWASIDRADINEELLLDHVAYAIDGVDPRQVLVVRLRPGFDKAFLLLLHGPDAMSLLCPYIDPIRAKPAVDCD